MHLHRFVRCALAAAALGVAGSAHAASLTGTGYSENFDEMGTAGTAAPTGWSLFKGCLLYTSRCV